MMHDEGVIFPFSLVCNVSFSNVSLFHLNFILQQQNMPPINRSSQSLIQLTNPNINNNHQRIPNAVGIMHSNNMGGPRGPRPLDQVTCYKVGTPFDFMHNFFSTHIILMPSKCAITLNVCLLLSVW